MSGFPINRVGWFLGDAATAAESCFVEFANVAVDFTEGESETDLIDPLPLSNESTDWLLRRLLGEALAEGVDRVHLKIEGGKGRVLFHRPTGEVVERDAMPPRTMACLFSTILVLAGEGGEFSIDRQIAVAIQHANPPSPMILALRAR